MKSFLKLIIGGTIPYSKFNDEHVNEKVMIPYKMAEIREGN